jgi:hypothetical protein
MAQIIIHTQSKIEVEDVEKLAQSIRETNPDIEIKFSDPKRVGYAVTWWEVVLIFIVTEAGKKVVGRVTDAWLDWAKERITEHKRPQYISIFGSDGVPIVAKLVQPSGEIEDKTDDAREQGPKPIPPVE